jgi:hypothetical protein
MADTREDALTQASSFDSGDFIRIVKALATVPDSQVMSRTVLDAYLTLGLPAGAMRNGKISVTVASNNLTLALKTLAGTDPSAADPVYVNLGGAIRTITAALSVTKNAGTNWFNAGGAELATQEIDYFVYLGYNATDGVVIGFSRIPYAKQYSDFSVTTTDEKYAAISTITTAASTDYYDVIGRFAASLSAGAGYTWTVPTFTAINLIQRPIYETRWLTFAPQHSRTGGAYSNLPTVNFARYVISARKFFFEERHTQNATPGSSGNQVFTLPYTSFVAASISQGANNSSAVSIFSLVTTGGVATMWRYDANAECTASAQYSQYSSAFEM